MCMEEEEITATATEVIWTRYDHDEPVNALQRKKLEHLIEIGAIDGKKEGISYMTKKEADVIIIPVEYELKVKQMQEERSLR